MGVDLIHVVQSVHTPLLDTIFIWITKLGVEDFYMILLPLVYWVINRDMGFKMTIVFLVAALTNGYLKDLLMLPRPSTAEGVRILYPESGTGYGFPSGHAQDNAALWGYVAARLGPRQRAWYWIGGIIIFLVSLSRIYLGLHYPTDVLGGLVFGFIIAAAALWLERRSRRANRPSSLEFVYIVLPLVTLPFYHTELAYKLVGFMVGVIAGYIMDNRVIGFSARSSILGDLLKVVIGYGGLLGLQTLTHNVFPAGGPQVVRYIILGLWATLIAPGIFKVMGLVRELY